MQYEVDSFDSTESLIMDGGALAATEGFTRLITYLEKQGMKLAGKVEGSLTPANMILAAAKLIISYASMDVDFQLEPNPLVRTTNIVLPGKQSKLTTTVKMDYTKVLNYANCYRIVLNSIGLDFDLPNHGPMEDVGVEMVGTKGFGNGGIVQFWGGNPARQVTDSNGVTTIGVEGQKQDHTLPERVIPTKKEAAVMVQVQLTRAANIFDVLGGALSPLMLPFQLLEQTRWITNGHYNFPVQDWEPGEFHGEGVASLKETGPKGLNIFTTETISVDFGIDSDTGKIDGSGTADVTSKGSWKSSCGKCNLSFNGSIPLLVEGSESAKGKWTLLVREKELAIYTVTCRVRKGPEKCITDTIPFPRGSSSASNPIENAELKDGEVLQGNNKPVVVPTPKGDYIHTPDLLMKININN